MTVKLQLLATVTSIILGLATCTATPGPADETSLRPNVVVEISQCDLSEYLLQEEIDDAYLLEQSPSRRDVMIEEIVQLWTMFFDDDSALPEDPRRQHFAQYAEYLADAVLMYEAQPTDLGGQLPAGAENTHLLLATMITKESSVTSDVVGKMGEVGLMQIHGRALAGYEPTVVRYNPKLGIILGVRWFAYQTSQCKMARKIPTDSEPWRDTDWYGPLSLYAGGMNAINKKTGGCYTFQLAINRIELTRFYRSRINALKS